MCGRGEETECGEDDAHACCVDCWLRNVCGVSGFSALDHEYVLFWGWCFGVDVAAAVAFSSIVLYALFIELALFDWCTELQYAVDDDAASVPSDLVLMGGV
jgi:hypothetical protein